MKNLREKWESRKKSLTSILELATIHSYSYCMYVMCDCRLLNEWMKKQKTKNRLSELNKRGNKPGACNAMQQTRIIIRMMRMDAERYACRRFFSTSFCLIFSEMIIIIMEKIVNEYSSFSLPKNFNKKNDNDKNNRNRKVIMRQNIKEVNWW